MSILFVLVFVVGEIATPHSPSPTAAEWARLALWPIGVVLGLALAWFFEGLGGALATLSLVGFYLLYLVQSGHFPKGPYFFPVAAPGMVFLLVALLSMRATGRTAA
jgi:hypothetical protein